MDSSIFRISLDVHKQVAQTHLAVRKGDTARKIVAALSDGGRPYRIDEGCFAVFKAKKPDGHVLYNDCAIINNCIVYEFTEQTASSAGYMHCELQLYGADEQIITSPKFAVIVSGMVYDDSEVESSDEFTALAEAMAELAELKATGLKGDPGDSAYEEAVSLGFEGTEAQWLESLTGPQGPAGPQGPKGEGDALKVSVTFDGEKYVADKTTSDIDDAVAECRTVYAQISGSILSLVEAEQAYALFQAENGPEYLQILIREDGTVEVQEGIYADRSSLGALYASLHQAVTDVNGDTRENALPNAEGARVRVYTGDNGRLTIALLEDVTETVNLPLKKDLDLVLGGHTLTLDGKSFISTSSTTGDIRILGGNAGSGRGRILRTAPQGNMQILAVQTAHFQCIDTELCLPMEQASEGGFKIIYIPQNAGVTLERCQLTAWSKTKVFGIAIDSGLAPSIALVDTDMELHGAKGAGTGIYSRTSASDIALSRSNILIDCEDPDTGGDAVGIYTQGSTRISGGSIQVQTRGMLFAWGVSVLNGGSLKITDKAVVSACSDEVGDCCGVRVDNSLMTARDSIFRAVYGGESNPEGDNYGAYGAYITNDGTVRAENCVFFGDARDGDSAGRAADCCYSHGLLNAGHAYLDNCQVTGTFAGLSHYGQTLYVQGGIYTGTQHGGIYFDHEPEAISCVNDAILRDGNYDGEFADAWAGADSATLWGACYVGGAEPRHDMQIYFDGCSFRGYKHALVMRGSGGEYNNTVSLSNCIFESGTINYHNNTHHVNVGTGCNITTDHIYTSAEIVEGMMIFTDRLYRRCAPDRPLTGRDFNALAALLQK